MNILIKTIFLFTLPSRSNQRELIQIWLKFRSNECCSHKRSSTARKVLTKACIPIFKRYIRRNDKVSIHRNPHSSRETKWRVWNTPGERSRIVSSTRYYLRTYPRWRGNLIGVITRDVSMHANTSRSMRRDTMQQQQKIGGWKRGRKWQRKETNERKKRGPPLSWERDRERNKYTNGVRLPLTWRSAEWATVAAPLATRQVYVPLCAGAIVLMLRALVKASYCRTVMAFLGDCSACPKSTLGPRFGPLIGSPAPAGAWTRLWPDDGVSCDVLIVSIGTLSFSHVNVSGRSPVTTTHCTLVRCPTFKSRAKLKGVILGGTERTIQRQRWHSSQKRFERKRKKKKEEEEEKERCRENFFFLSFFLFFFLFSLFSEETVAGERGDREERFSRDRRCMSAHERI